MLWASAEQYRSRGLGKRDWAESYSVKQWRLQGQSSLAANSSQTRPKLHMVVSRTAKPQRVSKYMGGLKTVKTGMDRSEEWQKG